jgi:uncharacterized protein GlcG (DUF336 family)
MEAEMPRPYETVTLAEAKQMLTAGEAKAASLGIAYNIAVVDAGGHLVAFVRQDGALIGSVDLAIDKAVTARLFDKTTAELATLAQSGNPLFGIQESNSGKVVIFGGGTRYRSCASGDRIPGPLKQTDSPRSLAISSRASLFLS